MDSQRLQSKEILFNEIYTNTRIVDISISGLLFEISDENLFQYLKSIPVLRCIFQWEKIS